MTPPAERRLLWITGAAVACRARATTLLAATPAMAIGWIGDRASSLPGSQAMPPGQGRRLLGQTLAAGVVDAHAGLDPDDLGALAGTIAGGGALLLLTPPPETWPMQPDPGIDALLSHGLTRHDFKDHFRARLQRLLTTTASVEHGTADNPPWNGPLQPPVMPAADGSATATPNAEQKKVIAAIQALARSPRPAPLLVTADRGRGKSAALGMAMAALKGQALRLTAPSRRAAATALAHAGAAAAPFLPPESVAASDDLLLIDEAAALPLGLVVRLVRDNPRCVLTGTVHGYEGSGHGLTLRLAQALRADGRPLHRLRLTRPVRWSSHDPLESFIDRLLLLRAEPVTTLAPDAPPCRIQREPPARLARHETDLEATFGLLVGGHYQTRPRDLRQLLDDPAMHIWTAREADRVIGVLAAREEGGLKPALSKAIHRGRRRPAGHLIAQSLTFHAGIAQAATYRGLRIQRLAVHPARRRRGIGQRLVAAARAHAWHAGLDWLGTSFAGTPALLDFWHRCQLQVVRAGNRLDPRSAGHAVIMLEALNPSGEHLLAEARTRLAVHLPDQLTQALRDTSSALQQRLVHALPVPDAASVAAIDRADLHAFAYGHRALLDSHGALARSAAALDNGRSTRERALLKRAIQHPMDSAGLVAAAGVDGRRAALEMLRDIAQQLPEAGHE